MFNYPYWGLPEQLPSNIAYTVTCTQGSYALSGKTQTFKRTQVLSPTQGSYALTGEPQLLKSGKKLFLTQGSYSLSGKTQILTKGIKLSTTQGTYNLSGQNVNLTRSSSNYDIEPTQGSYSLTGESQSLKTTRILSATHGSYSLTGEAQGLRLSRILSPTEGSYTLTGRTQSLLRNFELSTTQGVYSLVGESVNLTSSGHIQNVLTALSGLYNLSGKFADLNAPALTGGKSRWQEGMGRRKTAKTSHNKYPPSHLSHEIQKAAAHMSSLGGYARAKSLSSSERSHIATKAARARWR